MSDIWEPWTPKIGQRVKVRISAECPIHGQPDYLIPAATLDGLVGTVRDDSRIPGDWIVIDPEDVARFNEAAHWYSVHFSQTLIEHDGFLLNAEEFCAAELEPIP